MANRDELLRFAQENRQNPTKSEQILWKLLRNQQLSDLKFRRQHVIEPYIVDFACISKMLVVEIDGGYHEFIGQEDRVRQSFLESQGWVVLRFASDEVESNDVGVLEVLLKTLSLENRFNRTKHAPSGMMKPQVRGTKGKNLPGR